MFHGFRHRRRIYGGLKWQCVGAPCFLFLNYGRTWSFYTDVRRCGSDFLASLLQVVVSMTTSYPAIAGVFLIWLSSRMHPGQGRAWQHLWDVRRVIPKDLAVLPFSIICRQLQQRKNSILQERTNGKRTCGWCYAGDSVRSRCKRTLKWTAAREEKALEMSGQRRRLHAYARQRHW